MDAIIDRLVVTIHADGATRLSPDEIRAIVSACVAATRAEAERDRRRHEDVTAEGAYRSQLSGRRGGRL